MSVTINNLQLVWFPQDPANIQVPSIFEGLTGTKPDSIRINHAPQPSDPTRSIAEKVIDDQHVSLGLGISGRLELSFNSATINPSSSVPTLDTDKVLEKAREMIARASNLPLSLRISCITSTLHRATSKADAKRQFTEFIGFDPGIPDSMDEKFQINRRTHFADIEGNRFTQVSVAEITGVQIPLAAPFPPPVAHVQYALSVTYDFNTVPDGTVIDSDRQKNVFSSILSDTYSAIKTDGLGFLR